MPFVEKSHRDKPDLSIPGDLCYLEYRKIMDEWNKSPRWTTVDKIFKSFIPMSWLFSDRKRAELLALAVFFCKVVMKYEDEKEALNGEIK